MSALLASQRLQADTAGLTGPQTHIPTTQAGTITELSSSLIHGESGSLHYLFDGGLPMPVHDGLRGFPQRGPNGGYAHPDNAGRQVLGAGLGATVNGQSDLTGSAGGEIPVPNVAAAPGAAPAEGQASIPGDIADRARQFVGQAQERISGLFGG